jgi:hypothetical protein
VNIHEWADKYVLQPGPERADPKTLNLLNFVARAVPPEETGAEFALNHSVSSFAVDVLMRRSDAIGLHMLARAFAPVAMFCDSPGCLIIFAHALRSWQLRNGDATISDLRPLFPNGFPTRETLSEAWNAQKYEDFNSLDQCDFTDRQWGDIEEAK